MGYERITLGETPCYATFPNFLMSPKQRVYCVTHSCIDCKVLLISDQLFLKGACLDIKLGDMIALDQEESLCD
jgi:hypothetical protein